MLIPGSRPKIKYDIENYLTYLKNLVKESEKNHQLNLNLDADITPEILKKQAWEVIITATGTKQHIPPIKGINQSHVINGIELLKNPDLVKNSKQIIIIGGGTVGCETAYFLSHEMDKKVKVIEMQPYFMEGVCTANRGYLIHYLEKLGVELINCAKLLEVKQDTVLLELNISKTKPDPYNTWSPILPKNILNPFEKKLKEITLHKEIEADLIVLATGAITDNTFYYECQQINAAKELYNIGDSFRCGRIFEAKKAAYQIAIGL